MLTCIWYFCVFSLIMMINSQNPRHISILQNMDNPFRYWYKILQECNFYQTWYPINVLLDLYLSLKNISMGNVHPTLTNIHCLQYSSLYFCWLRLVEMVDHLLLELRLGYLTCVFLQGCARPGKQNHFCLYQRLVITYSSCSYRWYNSLANFHY